jgi:hypothetical protein
VAATAAAVVAATAAAVVAATAAAVVIAPPELVAGKIAAMEPATTVEKAMPTTKAAAVVAVDPPVVVMTIPVTAELRADASR